MRFGERGRETPSAAIIIRYNYRKRAIRPKGQMGTKVLRSMGVRTQRG
jgi:hypothetical protein